MEVRILSEGLALSGHVAEPSLETISPMALVLCHGFPTRPRGSSDSGHTYPQLAERIAGITGARVLSFNFRGTGESDGDFSLGGWGADLRAAIGFVLGLADVRQVWLAGFNLGGALALCAAGEDERVSGVASLGAPADFEHWVGDPVGFLDQCRELGVIRTRSFPSDLAAWGGELSQVRPLELVGKIPPRPLLLVHGADDDQVPAMEARVLADAADGTVDLRILPGAGHRLRHDPRAVAVLLGWLDRVGGDPVTAESDPKLGRW
ncbi:MAG: alpha/beta hydrolase family protein [Acidimicrobiales bacterium]